MKTKIISAVSIAAAISFMAIVPVFAQAGEDIQANNDQNTAASVDTSNTASVINATGGARADARGIASTTREQNAVAKLQDREQQLQAKAVQEITARVDSLNKLSTRIQSVKKLSASQIASFQTTIQAAIADMASLQAKIQSDTSTTSLMADLKSIAPDYRIYILVEPQISILSAADRVNVIVGTLQTLETKIQARLSSTTMTVKNIGSLQADLTDMNAKLTDATTQSAAASAEVTVLVPDNGDKTVMASNTAALKDARSKIQVATKDIQAAYKDAQAAVKGVRGTGDLKMVDSKNSKTASTTTQ
jgi:DNA repair exonuclease SbcCD ATPase subunit